MASIYRDEHRAKYDMTKVHETTSFPQFHKFCAEIQTLIFEHVAIVAAEDLPDTYMFEFKVCQDGGDTVGSFRPSPTLDDANKSVRILMQTCRAAHQAVINMGVLEVVYKKDCDLQDNSKQLRYAVMPFNYERSTFFANIRYDLATVRLCTRGFDFATRVKNLTLVVSPDITGVRELEDVCKIVERFPNVENCTLINYVFWSTAWGFGYGEN
ncbi:hypothetical protein N0V82_007835 [Gnomoniopsis sp. IMI 355080]|nr:hypothetical protein N0V82_007835 [Gnomoniopsis sp. IMI 355080]